MLRCLIASLAIALWVGSCSLLLVGGEQGSPELCPVRQWNCPSDPHCDHTCTVSTTFHPAARSARTSGLYLPSSYILTVLPDCRSEVHANSPIMRTLSHRPVDPFCWRHPVCNWTLWWVHSSTSRKGTTPVGVVYRAQGPALGSWEDRPPAAYVCVRASASSSFPFCPPRAPVVCVSPPVTTLHAPLRSACTMQSDCVGAKFPHQISTYASICLIDVRLGLSVKMCSAPPPPGPLRPVPPATALSAPHCFLLLCPPPPAL
eukprot:1181651-Prorocentrum_minimum.AAC.1